MERDDAANVTLSELLRGPDSMGALVHAAGHPSVPSPAIPHVPPYNLGYWTGGFNVARFGSRDEPEYGVDAMHMEMPLTVRSSEDLRARCARAVARSLLHVLRVFYAFEK